MVVHVFNASQASTNKGRVKQLAWSVLWMLTGESKRRHQGARCQIFVPSRAQLARLVQMEGPVSCALLEHTRLSLALPRARKPAPHTPNQSLGVRQ